MTLDRLKEIVGAYGADPARWPATERVAAQDLLERSAAARRLRDEAAALDRILDQAPQAASSALLAARILRSQPQPRRTDARSLFTELWPDGPAWRPAAALAASMVLGLAVGAFTPLFLGPGDASVDDEIASFWVDADESGWDG